MRDSLEVCCERCGNGLEVPTRELFEFDCRCPDCEGLLVLQFRPEALAGVITDFHDRPTKADSIEAFPSAISLEDARPTVPFDQLTRRADELAAFMNQAGTVAGDPRPAPDLASQLADPSPVQPPPSATVAAPQPPPLEESTPVTQPAAPSSGGEVLDDADEFEDDGLPDPYEEAARALDQAMTESVRKTRRSRRLSSDSRSSAGEGSADELEGLVEVVQVPAGGTGGRGSRTYERNQLEGETLPDASTSTGAIDLDWLALIEDAPFDEEETSVSRVIITLPEGAAPTKDASDSQKRQFQEAVDKLEQGGSAALTSLLSPDGGGEVAVTRGGAVDEDTRSWDNGDPDDGATKPWPAGAKPQGYKEDDDATREFSSGGAPEPTEDKTTDWAGVPNNDPVSLPGTSAKESEPDTRSWADAKRDEQATGKLDSGPHHADDDTGRVSTTTSSWSGAGLDRSAVDRALVSARNPEGPQAGAFLQLYQRLFGRGESGAAPRSVLVTSPRAGDGKTTVATNLALVGARINGGVVLVDANPAGSGDVLRAFGVRSRNEGLLEALQSEGSPSDYALPLTDNGQLDVIPLGIPSSDAHALLSSGRMDDFLERLRSDYPKALIVIDTSPTLQASEPQRLASAVDGVVLVTRAGSTPREDVARSIDLLGRDRVLGLVLNAAREGI